MSNAPSRLLRVGSSALLLLLGTLLARSSSQTAGDRTIDECLRTGVLGGLDEDESRFFSDFVQGVRSKLGLSIKVTLNAPWQNEALNVYTVVKPTPKLVDLRAWMPDNSLYSPSLNAIFFDRDLVREALVDSQGNVSYDGKLAEGKLNLGLRFYVLFAMLHELGHWEHTTHVVAFLGSRNQELSADTFAIDHVDRFLTADFVVSGRPFFMDQYGWTDLIASIPSTSRDSPFWRAILASASYIINEFAAHASYSSFYSDSRHPTLIYRFRRLVERVLTKSNSMDADTRSHFEILLSELDTLYAMKNNILCEIESNKIAAATWGTDRLWLTDRAGRLSWVMLEQLDSRAVPGSGCSLRTLGPSAVELPSEAGHVVAITTLKDGSPLIITDTGKVFKNQKQSWDLVNDFGAYDSSFDGEIEVSVSRFGPTAIQTAAYIHVIDVEAHSTSRRIADLKRDLRTYGIKVNGLLGPPFTLSGISGNDLYLTVNDAEIMLPRGVLLLHINEMKSIQFTALKVPDRTLFKWMQERIVTTKNAIAQMNYIAVGRYKDGINAWRVSAEAEPILIAHIEIPGDRLLPFRNQLLMDRMWFGLLQSLTPSVICISVNGSEMLYELDVETRRLSYPFILAQGGQSPIDQLGRGVLIPVNGANKAYVVTLLAQ